MKQSKRVVCVLLCVLIGVGMVFAGGQKQTTVEGGWKPTRPINIIVPWNPGGSTDQYTRIVAAELEKVLGVNLVIVHQPGASGSVGTKNVLDAPKDGYTWLSTAADDLAMYRLNGMLDTNIADWEMFLCIGLTGCVGVNADSKYQTFDDLLADFKARPGQIAIATSGLVSAGATYASMLQKFTGIDYKMVTYEGGGTVIPAVVSGEVEVTTQFLIEQTNMIRAKRIRPLVSISDTDFNLQGHGLIPSIRKWIPEMNVGYKACGFMLPKGTPQEVVTTLTNAWNQAIPNNAAIKKWADEQGAMVIGPYTGQEAQAKAREFYQQVAWIYYDAGLLKMSPDAAGIPRP